MKNASVALAAALAASLSASALAETRDFDLSGFSGVKAQQGVDVIVEVGSRFSVSLETSGDTDEALAEVRGNTLVLGRESKRGWNMNLGKGARYTYTVTMPSIDDASTSSGADMDISGIDAGRISLKASSGSDLRAEGSCERLTADASSGADIKAYGLTCGHVEADVSSGAAIEVTATQRVNADASSGGRVSVKGNPKDRNSDSSSGGRVTFRS